MKAKKGKAKKGKAKKITFCVLIGFVFLASVLVLANPSLIAWPYVSCAEILPIRSTFAVCTQSVRPLTEPNNLVALESPPAYKQSSDMIPGATIVTRISDNTTFGLKDGRARHQYSKRQAWNSDESLLEIGGKLIDSSNYDIVIEKIPLSTERVWSNVDPDIMYGLNYSNEKRNVFSAFNVSNQSTSLIFTLDDFDKCSIGHGEGTITNNDQRILFLCTRGEEQRTYLITYDLPGRTILGETTTADRVDWAGFSQSGQFVLMDSSETRDSNKYLTRYTPELKHPTLLSRIRHHGDFGVDDNGDDVYAMIGWLKVKYLRLKDGQMFQLELSGQTNPIGHGHISCRNIRRPGWCYISTGKNVLAAVTLTAETGNPLLKLANSLLGRNKQMAEIWGAHFSDRDIYNASPKASASPSGKQLVYTSNWHGTEEINDYIITIVDSR